MESICHPERYHSVILRSEAPALEERSACPEERKRRRDEGTKDLLYVAGGQLLTRQARSFASLRMTEGDSAPQDDNQSASAPFHPPLTTHHPPPTTSGRHRGLFLQRPVHPQLAIAVDVHDHCIAVAEAAVEDGHRERVLD